MLSGPQPNRRREWLVSTALPFWATAGLDDAGGFAEYLNLDGTPGDAPVKRLMVQARQVYVFSHAACLGWLGGLEAAEVGYTYMIDEGYLARGRWGTTVRAEGDPLPETDDLYTIAFILLALAWYARATGLREPIKFAHATMLQVQIILADGRGYRSSPRLPGLREQNPNMHLFEACIALFETTQDHYWLDEAAKLRLLFADTLFDPATATVAEVYDAEWRRLPDPAIEPGHQFEWAWLLSRYDRAAQTDTGGLKERLLRSAASQVLVHGLVPDQVTPAGDVLGGGVRLWGQAERLKMLVREDAPEADIERAEARLFEAYLDPAPAGCWFDRWDAEGKLAVDRIPASSLYHLFGAFVETGGE